MVSIPYVYQLGDTLDGTATWYEILPPDRISTSVFCLSAKHFTQDLQKICLIRAVTIQQCLLT